MPFVITVTTPAGTVLWLSAPGIEGIRTLVPSERAEVFQTEGEAHLAIAKMPQALRDGPLRFSIASAD